MLLRSMQQAVYTSANAGHFGLAYQAYTHFTSPIRRYPDLLVHRVIKAMLHGKRYQLDAAKMNVPMPAQRPGRAKPINPATVSNDLERWEVIGAHCSANERRADEASRDVEAWLKCRYMREHLGEEFAGTVSAVTSFGLFVQLDALYVEGLIHITELGGEYYRFDEVRQELRGERTGIRYATGAKVLVQVSRVDLDGRKIDFRLVSDNEEARLVARAMRDKSGGGDRTLPETASEALEQVRRQDREVKAGRKSKGVKSGKPAAAAHPVKAARKTARAQGAVGTTKSGSEGRRRR
jgi:ribonuclease R